MSTGRLPLLRRVLFQVLNALELLPRKILFAELLIHARELVVRARLSRPQRNRSLKNRPGLLERTLRNIDFALKKVNASGSSGAVFAASA